MVGNADASKVKLAINKLYANTAGSSGLSKRTIPGAVSAIQTDTIPDEVVNGKHRQYVANIRSQKFALNSTYAIYLFIGNFDDSPSAWATSPNLVGTHAVFAALPSADSPKNSKPVIPVTGAIPLTSMLLAKAQAGDLDSMGPEAVGKYLSDSLHWRVATVRSDVL